VGVNQNHEGVRGLEKEGQRKRIAANLRNGEKKGESTQKKIEGLSNFPETKNSWKKGKPKGGITQ